MNIIDILSNDTTMIPYRKELNSITGGVKNTLLLTQALYWWNVNGRKPFYKFIEPCNHPMYKEGDSWCEELGYTKRELCGSMNKLVELGIMIKKTDNSRITYHEVNEEKLKSSIEQIVTLKSTKCSLLKSTKCSLPTYTENTTENTTLSENQLFLEIENTSKTKFNYQEVFDYYTSFSNLVKHRSLTQEMKVAIDKFIKQTSSTVDDIKKVIERHSKVVETTEKSEYPVRARTIQELFGQKAYKAAHLIGSEYLDDGKYGLSHKQGLKATLEIQFGERY